MSFVTRIGSILTASALTLAVALLLIQPHQAVAGGMGGLATEPTQIANKAEAAVSAVKNTATAAATSITAGATTGLFAKEGLDGIAFHIAKRMVSNMTRSLINWINSGFQGSPSFVTDLDGLLLDTLDQVAGEYIHSLGGVGEFICSPFRLDVQAALSINYAQARSGMPSGPTACTLTGIKDNIENFLTGTMDSWDQWLSVTANPQNTPFGAYLEAEAKLNARLINAEGQTLAEVNWGQGFLSKKVCEPVAGTSRETCKITTPGQVISEALTFQLSTGPRTLIEADEVNELIGALINQLALKAVEGINGLLGLSARGSSGRSYLDEAVDEEVDIDLAQYKKDIDTALALERQFLRTIDSTASSAASRIASSSTSSTELELLMNNALAFRPQTEINICELNKLKQRYEQATSSLAVHSRILSRVCDPANPPPDVTSTSTATTSPNRVRQDVVLDFIALRSQDTLHTQEEIDLLEVRWDRRLRELN